MSVIGNRMKLNPQQSIKLKLKPELVSLCAMDRVGEQPLLLTSHAKPTSHPPSLSRYVLNIIFTHFLKSIFVRYFRINLNFIFRTYL